MKRASPFFRISHSTIIDRWLDIGLRERRHRVPPLRPMERELLEAWREISKEENSNTDRYTDATQMHTHMDALSGKRRQLESVRNNLIKTCRVLAHAGILGREFGVADDLSYSFYLREPEEVLDGWEGSPTTSQANRGLVLESGRAPGGAKSQKVPVRDIQATYELLMSLNIVPITQDDHTPWTMSLISQLIERVSRTTALQDVDTVRQRIQIDGETVEVEAGRTFFGWERGRELGVIVGDDAQLILAILTTVMQSITMDVSAGREPQNRVSLDLRHLSKKLTPRGESEANTYRAFRKAMARIINTQFRLTLAPGSPLARTISPSQNSEHGPRLTFGLLEKVVEGPDDSRGTWLEDNGEWEPGSAKMRYFSFSLNDALWRGLVGGEPWLVHPELLLERRGIVHKLYHHLRHRTHGKTPYRVSGEALMRMLSPQQESSNYRRDRQRFCKQLWSLMEEEATHDVGMNLLEKPKRRKGVISVRWFDLDVVAMPDDSHVDGILIEAQQSEETQRLLEQQEERLRQLRNRTQSIARKKSALTFQG